MHLMHVGMTVSDVERSAKFYRGAFGFRETASMSRNEEWIGDIVGYKGAHLIFIHMALDGVMSLELIQYRLPAIKQFHVGATYAVGNVHFCLEVPDVEEAAKNAVWHGAKLKSLKRPAVIGSGPNKGAKVVYLRDPDEITIELFQKA